LSNILQDQEFFIFVLLQEEQVHEQPVDPILHRDEHQGDQDQRSREDRRCRQTGLA